MLVFFELRPIKLVNIMTASPANIILPVSSISFHTRTTSHRSGNFCFKRRSMVFFHNITIGARVQVRWRGGIENGVIRYAGNMVTKDGEWVGLELDNRVGNTSGLYKGIQYFHCKDGYGIFTHARNIRFVPTKKLLHDTYRPLSRMSSVDDTLFAKTEGVPVKSYTDPTVISQQYLNGIKTLLEGKEDRWSEVARTSFHKSHLIGGHFSLALMEKHMPGRKLGSSSCNIPPFISPSSIPPIHVPRPILKRMITSEFFGTTIPRYCSLS